VFGWQTVVAQGMINGRGVMLKAGAYRVSIQGIRDNPLEVRLESGQRLQLTLNEAGNLIVVPATNSSKLKEK